MHEALRILLEIRPEEALPLRHSPPSRAWLAACRKCRGPQILFAFFEDLATEPDSAALACLLRKFQSQGSQRITLNGRVLVIDGPATDAFIYLDRSLGETAVIPRNATHVIVEHARVVESVDSEAKSVWLPRVTSVGAGAFERCSLQHVSLPVVESVGARAFAQCALRSVSLVARDFGEGAFAHCLDLQAVSFPFARTASRQMMFQCSALRSVSMPVAHRVCTHAFGNCFGLTAISLPAVDRVDDEAFRWCLNLETVSLPSLTWVEANAFSRCDNLSIGNFDAPAQAKFVLPDRFDR